MAGTPTQKIVKNYTIDQPVTSTVGESMIAVKDYWQTETAFEAYKVPVDFRLKSCIVGSIPLKAGTELRIVGSKERDNIKYNLVDILPGSGLRLLVGQDGDIPGFIVNAFGFGQGCRYKVDPAVALEPIKGVDVDTTKGYVNFELVYSGTAGNSIRILYREYSPDNLARSAFNQELTYDKDSKTISFKKLRIEVLSASSNEIRFIVRSDGY